MADPEHKAKFEEGVDAWNSWRRDNPEVKPNLQGVTLRGDLCGINLSDTDLGTSLFYFVDLCDADLRNASLHLTTMKGASFMRADLSNANIERARLNYDHLMGTTVDFSKAILRNAIFVDSNLSGAILREADLTSANLMYATFVETDLEQADLSGCSIYGISVWNIKGTPKNQSNLRITPHNKPTITADNLKVAQFIHLLLNNPEISEAIETIGRKAVLILGRFSDECKPVLDAIREELRLRDYLPIMFDCAPPSDRTTIETVGLLARMARFVIADLTDARSVLQELQSFVPDLPSVPVQPIILASAHEYGMLDFFRKFKTHFLPEYQYNGIADVRTSLY